MNSVTINNKTYAVPKMDFDMVCQLEENGVSLLAMNDSNPKIATTLRAFVALIIGCSLQEASTEIQAHLEGGGSIADLVTAITDALNESGFSKGNRQKKVSEFPDHRKKNRNRKRNQNENTTASQKS